MSQFRNLIALALLATAFGYSQTLLFFEQFDGISDGVISGKSPTYCCNFGGGNWESDNTGSAGGYPHNWVVSNTSRGAVGDCDPFGPLTNKSVHITCTSGTNCSPSDPGARFVRTCSGGGTCAFLGGSSSQTDRTLKTPWIDAFGFNNLLLEFNYIGGSGLPEGDDGVELVYSLTGLAPWTTYVAKPVTTPCCGGPCDGTREGQWTHYSVVLPAVLWNTNGWRIGWKWTNDNESAGGSLFSRPSFSVDDVIVWGDAPLFDNLLRISAQQYNSYVKLDWEMEKILSTHPFIVERSADGKGWEQIGEVASVVGDNFSSTYTDTRPVYGKNFYRIRQLGVDGLFQVSENIEVQYDLYNAGVLTLYPNPTSNSAGLTVQYETEYTGDAVIRIFDMTGKLISALPAVLTAGTNQIPVDISNLSLGAYLVEIQHDGTVLRNRLVISE